MPGDLIEIEEARRRVLERVEPLDSEQVSLTDALGRVLAEEVASAEAVPAFDNSAMDGFAVRAADTAGAGPGAPVELRLAGESRAGRPAGVELSPGEAIAISTGAMVPAGADSVVRVEDAGARGDRVEVFAAVEPGRYVRGRGEDVSLGDTVLEAGAVLGPAELGVLASVGRSAASCARRARVAVVTTGDELKEPHEDLGSGEVRNSSAYSVPALAEAEGAQVVRVETVGDDPEAAKAAVGRTLAADVAVVCGGVSVGEHDHVRGAMSAWQVEEVFWGVALRPGKPTWFGVRDGAAGGAPTLAFGLPGNPVSALVTFLLFVRPALLALAGADARPTRALATLDSGYDKRPGRAHAVRCRLRAASDGLHVAPTGPQGSHLLTSMLGADALAIVPAAAGPLEAGESVEIELLPGVFGRLRAR